MLPWCGDSVTDDAAPNEEECDDGPLNNDRAPNACRENCSLPWCGDGVVDNLAPNLEECEPESDCNSNGISDICDLAFGGSSADCNGNDVPDECDVSAGTSNGKRPLKNGNATWPPLGNERLL